MTKDDEAKILARRHYELEEGIQKIILVNVDENGKKKNIKK